MSALTNAAREALHALECFTEDIIPSRENDPLWVSGRAAAANLRAVLDGRRAQRPAKLPETAVMAMWQRATAQRGLIGSYDLFSAGVRAMEEHQANQLNLEDKQ